MALRGRGGPADMEFRRVRWAWVVVAPKRDSSGGEKDQTWLC